MQCIVVSQLQAHGFASPLGCLSVTSCVCVGLVTQLTFLPTALCLLGQALVWACRDPAQRGPWGISFKSLGASLLLCATTKHAEVLWVTPPFRCLFLCCLPGLSLTKLTTAKARLIKQTQVSIEAFRHKIYLNAFCAIDSLFASGLNHSK